jgi:phage-related baseplate assembly protein
MAVTLPELDDRSYVDLAEEARSLLVTFAPELTNHNPSDPLVTLTELFAYLTDVLLFRLNTVTDANRTAFLRLLNPPTWQAPTSHDELEAEVRRTVNRLRAVDRAVTTDDYELLARAADPEVARAHCVPGFDLSLATATERAAPAAGTVSVVIVPSNAQSNPGPLLAKVSEYLEPRRLLGTRVRMVAARLVPLRVRLTVRLLPEAAVATMSARIGEALTRYLDPIHGGDGRGWPLGRSVHVSEIYRLLDTLPGVDFVTRTAGPDPALPLDELVPSAEFSNRIVRNDQNELVSITLQPGELVLPRILPADITVQPASSLS